MEAFRKRYEKIEVAGQGTYGVVYKVYDRVSNQVMAWKKIRLEKGDTDVPCTAIREAAFLKRLRHKVWWQIGNTVCIPYHLHVEHKRSPEFRISSVCKMLYTMP